MNSNPNGIWCILYRKNLPNEALTGKDYSVMKIRRSDGVMVSAKTYDDVFKFVKYNEAFQFAKEILAEQPTKYDVSVRRVCRARGDAFYLAGN